MLLTTPQRSGNACDVYVALNYLTRMAVPLEGDMRHQ